MKKRPSEIVPRSDIVMSPSFCEMPEDLGVIYLRPGSGPRVNPTQHLVEEQPLSDLIGNCPFTDAKTNIGLYDCADPCASALGNIGSYNQNGAHH